MVKQKFVTLLTDFGTRDPYVATMKGIILRTCPQVQIVDICHDIEPHDILGASFALAQAAPYFPPDTVHIVVVDPGVGTDRKILAAKFAGQRYLFPDNGVITFIARTMLMEALAAVHNTENIIHKPPSQTFHGRDIFAPVAAYMLNGMEIAQLGPQPDTYQMLELSEPQAEEKSVRGEVIYVDHFGNLISNIPQRLIQGRFTELSKVNVSCANQNVGGIFPSYSFVEKGSPMALINSMGLLEIAINQGRACDVFNAKVGVEVHVTES